MPKVAQHKSRYDKPTYQEPTHTGILRKVGNPQLIAAVKLTEVKLHWASTKKILYRKSDGLERGKIHTSIWQLDISSIKPIGEQDENRTCQENESVEKALLLDQGEGVNPIEEGSRGTSTLD